MDGYAKELGARLREVRTQQGLTLQAVEDKSGRRWKAVVVGSYERGDRGLTMQKLFDLAGFYGIPVAELLPDARPVHAAEAAVVLTLDLPRLAQLPAEQAGPLARYAATIQSQRDDYNGRVLTLRSEDLKTLATIYDLSPEELTAKLVDWGVLGQRARSGGL